MNIKIDVDIVGVALLVSNDYKTLGKGTELPFTHADANDLEKTLGEFSYAVYKKENVSAEEFVSYCKSLAEFEYPPTCNRILVYYSGIGSNGTLLMQHGGTVNTEDLMSTFKVSTANNVTLANIAKMFFFDTFCGSREVNLYYDPWGLRGKTPDDHTTSIRKIPRVSNALVAYSSSSYEGSTGRRWTNCFVTALRQSKERDDVCHILTCANVMMREQNSPWFKSEFISSLVNLVCFKQKGCCKVRNILLLGMSGSGKTRIMSCITGENLEKGFPFIRPIHLHKKLSINNNEYHCTFLKPLLPMLSGDNHDVEEQIVKSSNREILKRLNLIIYVVQGSHYRTLDVLQMYTKFLKNTHSISALVFTHCGYNDAERSRFVEGFKSIDCFKDFAASMGKGIYTVDFPTLDYFFDKDKEQIKQIMQKDVIKLHQLIEESSDVVDVLKSNDSDVPSNQCAII